MALKAQFIKGKTDNLDIIEIKSYFVKDRFKWMKRQATDWEKMLVDICGQGLVSRIYKELSELNIKKANLQIRTWAKDMKEDFTEEDTQMANKHIKIFPTLVSRETHIKTTRYPYTLIRMT